MTLVPTRSAAETNKIRPYAWYALLVILVAYVLAFIDRQMLNLLVEPIKRDLHLNDFEISLLQGFAFALTLSITALPVGRLIDTGRRTFILATGVALWSLMTVACGAAGSFPMLVLSRAGVAGAEATMTPTALSLLGDYFPARRIGVATGIYATGVHLGSGLALILGGWLVALGNTTTTPLAGLGSFQGWRFVFAAIGLPGIFVALWVACLREPARGGCADSSHAIVPWRDALEFFRNHGWAQTCANLAAGFALMATYGAGAWAPAYFSRHFGWSPVTFGPRYGLLTLLTGVSGILTTALLGDWLRSRRWRDARLRILTVTALSAAPLYTLAARAENPYAALYLLAAANLFNSAAAATGPAILQEIAPARLRGLTHGLALLTVNLIALGLGPTLIAAFTDYVLHNEKQVGTSLAVVPPAALSLAAFFGWMGRRPFRRAIQGELQQHVT